MQRNKVHAVKTIDRVAAELGETVDSIFDIAIEMETEDGVVWVYSLADDGGTIAFTEDGVECLRNLIEEHQSAGS